jgi:hypothetical protein
MTQCATIKTCRIRDDWYGNRGSNELKCSYILSGYKRKSVRHEHRYLAGAVFNGVDSDKLAKLSDQLLTLIANTVVLLLP